MIRWPRCFTTFFYDLFLILAFIVALPRILYAIVVYGKYKKSLPERFGLRKPKAPPGNGPLVWFHGASVGEISLLLPIISRFRKEYPQWRCVVTACSEAGVATAERLYAPLGASTFVFPFDHSLIIKPLVRYLSPSLVIFSEGDCWMNFVREAKRVGAKTVVINGKLSEHSSKIFSCLKTISRNYFSSIDQFFLQDECYQQRFLQLGVAQDKMQVTGNIKTYVETYCDPLDRDKLRDKLGITEEDRVLVLGSVHIQDLQAWLPSLRQLQQQKVKILLVPRRLETIKKITEICSKEGWEFRLWSQNPTFKDCDLVIVDLMGILKSLYQVGDLAFVGGTFDPKVGGHNLLEPLQARTPLIFGPYIQSQSELALRLIQHKAGICIEDTHTMLPIVQRMLTNLEIREEMLHQGFSFLENEKMAFIRTWNGLKEIII